MSSSTIPTSLDRATGSPAASGVRGWSGIGARLVVLDRPARGVVLRGDRVGLRSDEHDRRPARTDGDDHQREPRRGCGTSSAISIFTPTKARMTPRPMLQVRGTGRAMSARQK